MTIAVIDSGLDTSGTEFTGRVAAASRDMYSQNRGISGTDTHGTQVALVAAAARNNSGVLGMAYDATILALRVDEPGSCDGASGGDCNFVDSVLSQAVTYAVQNGAKVINLSLGGDQGASTSMKAAVAAAVNAGLLVVVSAGNESAAEVNSFAAELDNAAPGGVLIVGSVDANGAMSSFSDRAGAHAAQYIAARGEDVCCEYRNGQMYVDPQGYVYVLSGTSFSAPQVAGAAALLKQAFPNLTGRQVAQLLLSSAADVGATGVDAIYGHGLLDIAKAMQPSGTTTLAGSSTAVALSDSTGATSTAMGDAVRAVSLPTILLDSYGRAYRTNLAGTLRGAGPTSRLAAAVGLASRNVTLGSERLAMAFTIDDSRRTGAAPQPMQLRLSGEDAEQARVLAARITARVDPRLQLGFAYREQADGLTAQLQGQTRPAFLVAPAAGADFAWSSQPAAAFVARRQLGAWGLTASAESGEVVSGSVLHRASEMFDRRWRAGITSYGLALDRRFGSLETTVGLTAQAETDTLLGGRFHPAFGVAGADTMFLDAGAGWTFAQGWRLGGAVRAGFTQARQTSLVAAGSRLATSAWSLDLTRRGVFTRDDTIGLRLSQPLRVESGGLNLLLPQSWSYDTLSATYGIDQISLTPAGRELIGELGWQGRLLGGNGAASLFYRRDPGHYAQLPDDKGAALRWSARF